jgi:hypothetical protein
VCHHLRLNALPIVYELTHAETSSAICSMVQEYAP